MNKREYAWKERQGILPAEELGKRLSPGPGARPAGGGLVVCGLPYDEKLAAVLRAGGADPLDFLPGGDEAEDFAGLPFRSGRRGCFVYWTEEISWTGYLALAAGRAGASGGVLCPVEGDQVILTVFGRGAAGSAWLSPEMAALPRRLNDTGSLLWRTALLLYGSGLCRTLLGGADRARKAHKSLAGAHAGGAAYRVKKEEITGRQKRV